MRIILSFRKVRKIRLFKKVKLVRSNKKHYLKHKEGARHLIVQRVDYFSDIHNFKYNKVSIKNQKTRWGSCSTKGNLNFNYKLLFLEPEIRDYIIVHELCHLKELNHSHKFWALVEDIMPNCFEVRRELRKQGLFVQ